MNLDRRDFLQIAASLGLISVTTGVTDVFAGEAGKEKIRSLSFSDIVDFKAKGKATILHICDMHAHIKPMYWREPSTLISAKNLVGNPGFICGDSFSSYYDIKHGSLEQYFDTYNNFEELAKKFGKMGGIAHMKPVIEHVRKERGKENVILLDSGDTWQGTAIALKTRGEAMVGVSHYLGVDVMVGHWEFTYGKERVKELIRMFKGQFISQNVINNDPFSDDFEELIFPAYTIKEIGGAKIGVIGQSFPFTSTANPKYLTENWSFALRPESLQGFIDELKTEKKVDCVVLLSHDGFSVDQELAKKVKGLDFIFSGHTHDPSPKPIMVGDTKILISGSHGKYVSRLDLEIKNKKVIDFSYKLIPVASKLIPADKAGEDLVAKIYKPYDKELSEVLGKTKGLLYKRDTFYSTFDALIGLAIQDMAKSDIVFTPGYRWGSTLLPGDNITKDHVYEMTAITYPQVYTFDIKGTVIANLMEDIADNVFNSNPLLQQGGDMSRLTGATYDITISAKSGKRVTNFKIGGKPIDLNKTYRVSSWGGNLQKVGENQDKETPAIYEVVSDYIRKVKVVDISLESNVKILDFDCGCPKKGAKCS